MTRDYKNTTHKKTATTQSSQRWFGWPWLGAGIIMGLSLVGYQYWKQNKATLVTSDKKTVPHKPPAKTPAPATNQMTYDFYNELPNGKIKLPEPAAQSPKPLTQKPAARTPATPKLTAYSNTKPSQKTTAPQKPFLQVGAFRRLEQAKQHQLKLTLLNFNVSIKTVQKGQSTLYRVYIGPFSTKSAFKAAQKKLQQHQIASLPKRY